MNLNYLLENIAFLENNILLQRLVIIFVYAILAKAIDYFIVKVLRKLTAKTAMALDDQLIAFLHTPICWTVFSIGLLHAFSLQPPLSPPWQMALPAASRSLILLVWLIAVFKMSTTIATRYMARVVSRGKIGKDLYHLLQNLFRVFIIAAGILWILSIWQVDLTPMFASAGIVGIAIALAAKDTLANFFGGISIFADRTYKVGDYIIIDNSDRGEVAEIGIRSTRIKTRDDVLITIPNSILANSKIINESAPEPRFRIRIPVGVAYGSDLEQIEDLLLQVALANPAVVKDPAPRVRMRQFGASSIDFQLLCWIDAPSQKGLETHNILKAIYRKFNDNSVTIPFPQRDIHLYQEELPDA